MILVVGGSKGLGLAISKVYSKKYKVIVLSRSKNEKKKNITFIKCNINNNKEINQLIKKIPKKSLNSIFCVAGIINKKDTIHLSNKFKQQIINTNFISISNICQELISRNKIKNNGLICFCSSVSTLLPRSKQVYYTSSKIALRSFYQSLLSLKNKNNLNLRISNLMLGFLDTSMNAGKKTFFKKTKVEYIAKNLLVRDNKLDGEYFYPKYWKIIEIIFKILPTKLITIFVNRLNL